jgi:Histidine kinase
MPDPSIPNPVASAWQRFATGAVRTFHAYGNWLVGISWKRFFLLAVLLMILASVLQRLPPFSRPRTESRRATEYAAPATPEPTTPRAPKTPSTTRIPDVTIDDSGVRIRAGSRARGDDVTISIDERGVRITPHGVPDAATASAGSASGAASAASSGADRSVRIALPPGADTEQVKRAVEEARDAVVDAIEESRQSAEDARQAADDENDKRGGSAPSRKKHLAVGGTSDPLETLAFFFIVASAILKITYKGRMQAEVKAAVATEAAESEQLKRQVVEARMAAMQAQVEPHFLFNTLASIDHLIETDPPRASTMQKNLIAMLRASMPAMRESQPGAHDLGRELAVIRPYLEILKVRMEERLQTVVEVPEGLLSAEFPSMMIQSLVENAIKHGLEPKPEGGLLTVRAEIVHGKLAVTVADTGVGFGRAPTAGTGIGLANIRERLQLLYGGRASVTVAANTPTGTIVTLAVPYQARPSEGVCA